MGYKSREAWSQTTFNMHELQIKLDKNALRNFGSSTKKLLYHCNPIIYDYNAKLKWSNQKPVKYTLKHP